MSVIALLIFILLPLIVLSIIGVVILITFLVTRKKKQSAPTSPPLAQAENAVESPSTTAKTLGTVLKENRIRCNMTQEFVAEQLDVSRQAVSKWENGTADPSTGNLLALAKLYDISADALLKEAQA
jgi:DNA-binding XRE family transcriptional regulator